MPDESKPPPPMIEQTRVIPVLDFPCHLVIELADVDGNVYRGRMSPLQAHGFSDDVLKGVAVAMKASKGKDAETG